MLQPRGRKGAFWPVALLTLSCGGSVDLDKPRAAGGTDSDSDGYTPAPGDEPIVAGSSAGGAAGATAAPESDADGDGGDRDSGGDGSGGADPKPEPLNGYGLLFIEPLPPTQALASLSAVHVVDASRDGSLLIAHSITVYPERDYQPDYREERMMVWTPQHGTQPLPFLEIGELQGVEHKPVSTCVAEDGSRAIFEVHNLKSAPEEYYAAWSFTPDGKLEAIRPPSVFSSMTLETCSADASRATFSACADPAPLDPTNCQLFKPLYWQLGQSAVTQVAVEPEQAGSLSLSADGSSGVLNVSLPGHAIVGRRTYRWSPSTGRGASLEEGCGVNVLSLDGSTLLGVCLENNESIGFRWTQQGKTRLSPELVPFGLSRDGRITLANILGATSALAIGEDDGPMQTLELVGYEYWGSMTASDDMKTLYFEADPGPPEGHRQQALRWSASEGIVPLRGPLGSEETSLRLNLGAVPPLKQRGLSSTTPDGSVAIGLGNPGSFDAELGLVWDGAGVRDILSELEQAQVDVRDTIRFLPERVWIDGGIHVQGACINGDEEVVYYGHACIAELPLR